MNIVGRFKFNQIMLIICTLISIGFIIIGLTLNNKFHEIDDNIYKIERHPITVLLAIKDIKYYLSSQKFEKAENEIKVLEERFLGDKSEILKLKALVINQDTNGAMKIASNFELFAEGKLNEFIENIGVTIDSSRLSLIIISIVIMLLTTTLLLLLSKVFKSHLSKITEILVDLSTGKIKKEKKSLLSGKSEIATLLHSCDVLSTKLHDVVGSLNTVSGSVSSSSEELTVVMNGTAHNAQSELSQVEEISTAISELSSTSREMSTNAVQAEGETNQAMLYVEEGSKTLGQSISLIKEIDDSVQQTADMIEVLKNNAMDIGEVTTVISSISEQTNLLALNAAIEAARAGEQGRGFAVVADEVRNLAAKTQESTKNIQEIISNLQEQSEKANKNMIDNVTLIKDSVKLSENVKSSFNNITLSVQAISDINTLVATASQEQYSVTEDIAKNTTNAFDLVTENVSAVSQSLQAAKELSLLAEKQNKELLFFKI